MYLLVCYNLVCFCVTAKVEGLEMTTRNGTDNGNVPNGNNYHSKENIKKVIVYLCVHFPPYCLCSSIPPPFNGVSGIGVYGR